MVRSMILIAVFILLISCNRAPLPGSPEEALLILKNNGNKRDVLKLYTDETINNLKTYMNISGMKEDASINIMSIIPAASEYEITGKKIEEERCTVTLIFTKHPSQNAIGQGLTIHLNRIGNGWKIDQKEDFVKLIDSFRSREAESYLKKVR